MSAGRIIGNIIGFSLLGAIALSVVALILMLILNAFNPRCGTPGDSGGCEMGLVTGVVAAIPFGFAAGIGIWRGIRRPAT